jgi:predicted metal-dependent hydrolase
LSEQSLADGLRRAAELFNDARYHAAHEVLDELWEATHGEDSDFLKGLIQACIAMHHYQDGNLEGARRLYSGHRQYLGRYLPAHGGVDVGVFLGEMQRALLPVVRPGPEGAPAFEAAPRPRLEVGAD